MQSFALPSQWWVNPNMGNLGPERSFVVSPIFVVSGAEVSITFDSYSSNEGGYPLFYDIEHVQLSVNGGRLLTCTCSMEICTIMRTERYAPSRIRHSMDWPQAIQYNTVFYMIPGMVVVAGKP